MAEVLTLYKSPAQQRGESIAAYVAGVLAVAALRTYTELPHAVSAVGLIVAFIVVPILNTWRLRHAGGLLPAAETARRRSEDLARQNATVSFVTKAVGFGILMTTIMLATSDGSIAQALREELHEPWLLALMVAIGGLVGWNRVQLERSIVKEDLGSE